MNIFVAGASGAIGRPLITELLRQDHRVTGMTQSETGATRLRELGAIPVIANAFDAESLQRALGDSKAEVVIDELTALPKHPAQMPKAAAGDRKLRLEGGGNLYRAAHALGVRRYIQQSSGFFLRTEQGLADETSALSVDASPSIAASSQTYSALETRIFEDDSIEGVALRYGFFYGPHTWYHPDGGAAEQVRNKEFPLVGKAQAVWSFVHVHDAALATVSALTAEPGIYNIVDDDPSPVSVWLPAFAQAMGAPPPDQVSELTARLFAGEDAVYYTTKLCGASNAKARKLLDFQPRRLEWL